MTRKSYPSDLTDEPWALIEPLTPKPLPGGRPRSFDPQLGLAAAVLSYAVEGEQ